MGCEICHDLQLSESSQEGGNFRDYKLSDGTRETLSASAEKCLSCSILWEAVQKFEESHGRIHSAWTLRRRVGQLGLSYNVIVNENGDASKWNRVIHLYTARADIIPEWPALNEAKDIPIRVSGQQNLVELKSFLERCTSDHMTCQTQLKPPLPTRMIDVSVDPIRLVETKHRKDKYIALSHCWGLYQPLKTLKSNYKSHQVEISMRDLPKTFRDAIFVARYLDVKYLWIDSLCIIQDSVDDWQAESSLMASVYGNSYVALLAAASRDGRGGLFNEDGRHRMEATFHRSTAQGKGIVVKARSSLPHKPYVNFTLNLGDPDLPLFERSWCFQEYILSPRIAHFTRDEIIWQCENSQGCNCGDMSRMAGGRETLKGQVLDARARRRGEVLQTYCQAARNNRLHLTWWNLVEAYTTKLLTFDGDKLPALSGIARYMQQQQSDDVYLAGMWRSELADDLFWRSMPVSMLKGEQVSTVPAHRPKGYRAPSWSWVSVNARIGHLGKSNLTPDRSKILESECRPAGVDPTGSVESGYLLVEGLITEARAWLDDDDELNKLNKLKLVSPTAQALPDLVWQADVQTEASNSSDDPSVLYVLWWTFESQEEARALILEPTEETHTFRRIGVLLLDEFYCGEDYDWDCVQDHLETVAPTRLTIL